MPTEKLVVWWKGIPLCILLFANEIVSLSPYLLCHSLCSDLNYESTLAVYILRDEVNEKCRYRAIKVEPVLKKILPFVQQDRECDTIVKKKTNVRKEF